MLGDGGVEVKRLALDSGRHVAHFAKLQLCGCVWTCPVCGPRIRQLRADDVNTALHKWYAAHGPRSILFLTLTLPHDFGEKLGTVLDVVRGAFSSLVAGYAWQKDKAEYGLSHYVRAHDVTFGKNGPHPHLHILLFADRPLSAEKILTLRRRLFERWSKAVASYDRRAPTYEHGVVLEAARSIKDLAFYLAQVSQTDELPLFGARAPRPRKTPDPMQQEFLNISSGKIMYPPARTEPELVRLARPDLELARGDLKQSRHHGHRTPWQVLADFEADNNGTDLALWHEWEAGTKGVHSIRWSKGLRAAVGMGAELTDEQLVCLEVGGEVVYTFHPEKWKSLMYRRNVKAAILEAAESGGALGVRRYLNQLDRIDQVDKANAAVVHLSAVASTRLPAPCDGERLSRNAQRPSLVSQTSGDPSLPGAGEGFSSRKDGSQVAPGPENRIAHAVHQAGGSRRNRLFLLVDRVPPATDAYQRALKLLVHDHSP